MSTLSPPRTCTSLETLHTKTGESTQIGLKTDLHVSQVDIGMGGGDMRTADKSKDAA